MIKNIKTTYFIKDNKAIGFLDTADCRDCGERIETMDKIGEDWAVNCTEKTDKLFDALDVHNAWQKIICVRYGAKAVVVRFMGENQHIDSFDDYLAIEEYNVNMALKD